MLKTKILYDTSLSYPNSTTNSVQTRLMAEAFSEITDTTLIVNNLSEAAVENFSRNSKLDICNMSLNKYPYILKKKIKKLRIYYLIFTKFRFIKDTKVIYIRRPKDLYFWGEQRKKKKFSDWIICYDSSNVDG